MSETRKGNTVGSRFAKCKVDPVTTDLEPSGESDIGLTVLSNQNKFKSLMIRRPPSEYEFPPYISGYVDGKGCFTVSISRRTTMKVGWELRPSFSVSQNSDRAEVLYLMMHNFKCGSIRPDRSDSTLKYEVRSLKNLVDRIIPHFEEYPLLSSKQEAFWRFRQIILDMSSNRHLSPETISDMLLRSTEINNGLRKYRFEKI
jgi:hypothetical protein